ncbi:MAG TPA: aldo/keto reductase, partial [Thermoanaerobaculia bacterium]|nr:aldo/keto reductase [Thermoanaerobaculia bacterium]
MSRREAIALLAGAAFAPHLVGKPSAGKPSTATMLTKAIPSSKEQLPVIGLGTWQTFDVGASGAVRKPLGDVLALFAKLGGRVVDSSPMYGRSESVAGELSVQLGVRDDLFIATKVWTS